MRLCESELKERSRLEFELTEATAASSGTGPRRSSDGNDQEQGAGVSSGAQTGSGVILGPDSYVNTANLQAIVNYLRIIQNVTKGKEQRIASLVQFKSFVCARQSSQILSHNI